MNQRQLTFQEAIEKALKFNYCNFSGRASRSEYWWFALLGVIISFVLQVLSPISAILYLVVCLIVELGLLLPSLGLAVRRLHDIGKSGWWLLIGIIPIVGTILLIVWFCQPSNNAPNQYGAIPNVE